MAAHTPHANPALADEGVDAPTPVRGWRGLTQRPWWPWVSRGFAVAFFLLVAGLLGWAFTRRDKAAAPDATAAKASSSSSSPWRTLLPGVLIGLLAAVLPASMASRLKIVDALRRVA